MHPWPERPSGPPAADLQPHAAPDGEAKGVGRSHQPEPRGRVMVSGGVTLTAGQPIRRCEKGRLALTQLGFSF